MLPASEINEIYRIKPFKYLIVNSGAFDFAKKKIEYFNAAGKALSLKKIIFTDYPGVADKRTPERIIISRDPSDFIKKISQFR